MSSPNESVDNADRITDPRQDQQETLEKIQKIAKPIPLIDEITLGPIAKYQRFNIFPWEFFFHLLVLIFSTAQILL